MQDLKPCHENIVVDNLPCVVCNHLKANAIYTYDYQNQLSHIYRCMGCGHLFMHPIPLPDLESRNMDSMGDAEFFGSRLLPRLHEKLVIEKEIKLIKKYLSSPNPTLLDIGCGTGWTTAIWKKHGFNVSGLESSPSRGQRAKDIYGIQIYKDHVENFSPKEKFDVVIMRHLLEHIEHPDSILKKIHSFLKEDGLLLIIIPNINSIGRYIFKENWAWILPWHLHFYTPKTLSQLLEKTGYKKLHVYQTPSPLWYPNSFCNTLKPNSILSRFFSQAPKILTILPFVPIIALGAILGLNDNMTLIFQNKNLNHE